MSRAFPSLAAYPTPRSAFVGSKQLEAVWASSGEFFRGKDCGR